MPLAESFIAGPLSLLGGGAGANLIVGAVATRLIARRGLELPGADAGGGLLDGSARVGEILGGGRMPSGQAGLEEAQLDARGQLAGGLLMRQRVHLELEALTRALVGGLRLRHAAGLVSHHHPAPRTGV